MSRSSKGKGRSAKSITVRVQYDPTLKSSLVHLPMCLYAPLVDLAVPPQSLVVEIDASPTSPTASPYYAGWSGMSAAPLSVGNSLSQNGTSSANGKASASDVLNISPSLAASFHPPLQDGATCSVRLLRSPPLPTATKIDVTPLSADDWEILSLHAEEVELNMLGQVRAATTNQVLTVHVGRGGNTVVRFRVDSTTPSTAGNDAAEPDTEDADTASAIAVRLSTDTEVIIAPRLRKKAVDPAMQEEHSLQPINKPAANGVGAEGETQALRQTLPKLLWRVLPQRFADGLNLSDLSNGVAVPSTSAVGHTQLQQIYPDGRLSVTKVSCPTNNSASEMSAVGRDKNSTSASTNRFDDAANEASNTAGALPVRPTASARFVNADHLPGSRLHSDAAWPERHVLLGASLREQLGVQDYDLVRFGPPPPGFGSSIKPAPAKSASQAESSSSDTKSKRDAEFDLAGVEHILRDASEAISSCFRARALQSSSSSDAKPFLGSSCLLLTGGPGSGKTVIAKQLATDLSRDYRLCLATSYHDCSPFSEERVPVLRARFSEWLNEAAWKAPSLLILDNVDRIIPAEMEHVDSQRSRQLAEAFVARVRDCVKSFGVFVVATAQGNTSIHGLLNSSHLWLDNLQLKPPGKEGRREILGHLVAKKISNASGEQVKEKALMVVNGDASATSDLNFVTLATQTEGYLPADLRDLVERATHQAAIRAASASQAQDNVGSGKAITVNGIVPKGITHTAANGDIDHPSKSEDVLPITMEDFTQAQDGFTPLFLRDVKLEKSSVAWSDIGGLVETRRVLRETLEWPTKYAAIFASCPLRLRSGLLLYGYPGCGKTLLASAVAKECGLNFISVKGPEILNKYIGASEKSVRDLFDRAQAAKPCVLFFDEFDSIAPKRGHDSTGVTDRVVNQMLTQMDGAEGLDGVYVLAATSRPDLIDSALLRPGRLDKSLLCNMPTKEDRLDIMHAIARKVHLSEEVDLEKWAARTEGYSGADLQALLYNAHLEAIHESITAASEEKEAAKQDKNDSATDGTLKFTTIASGAGGAKKTLSGAERQALVRKLELVLKNSQPQQKSAKLGKILPPHLSNRVVAEEGEVKKAKSKVLVTEAHLETSIKSTRPSVPVEEQRRLRRIYRTFAGDRDGNFPDGEASNQIGARSSLM